MTAGGEAGSATVTVVIVNYRSGDHLRRCLRSLEGERLSLRVRVVDNGSRDGSLEGVEEGGPMAVEVIRNPENRGFAVAVNQALKSVDTPWVMLLNPDCEVIGDALGRLVAALETHPGAGMIGPRLENPDGSLQHACRRHLPDPVGVWRRLAGGVPLPDEPPGPWPVEAISGACMMIRRRALEEVGGLDESFFMHWEDLDWCKRFGDAGWRVLYLPAARVLHYKGVSSRSRPLRVLWYKHAGIFRFYRKHYGAPRYWLPAAPILLAVFGLFVTRAARLLVRRRNG